MTLAAGWTPSAARSVGPAIAGGAPARGIRAAAPSLSWAAKAPAEQLDYSLDLAGWLADGDDALLTADASVSPNGDPQDVQVAWMAVMNGGITLLLTGGRPATAYLVQAQARTTAGRVAVFDVALQVTADAAPAPAPVTLPLPMALLDTSYQVLLLAPGAPLVLTPPNVLRDASGRPLFLVAATPLLLA